MDLNFCSLESEPTWFVHFKGEKLDCMVINYVDDLMIFGSLQSRKQVCENLRKVLKLKVQHFNI